MRWEGFDCEDCEGTGIDPGSLHEPEACLECQGSKKVLVQTDPLSHGYGNRKPMGRAFTMPPVYNGADVLEQKYRRGE